MANLIQRLRIPMLIAVLVIAAVVAWQFNARPKALKVAVVEVDRGEVLATVANTRAGTVDACRRAGMSPALGGQIAHLPVREGDAVAKGQVMLELWNEDVRAELERSRRDVIASKSRADEVCVRADVARAEANRLTRLNERGLAAEEETARAVGDANARKAACNAARDHGGCE